jgi:hypothetical protein
MAKTGGDKGKPVAARIDWSSWSVAFPPDWRLAFPANWRLETPAGWRNSENSEWVAARRRQRE